MDEEAVIAAGEQPEVPSEPESEGVEGAEGLAPELEAPDAVEGEGEGEEPQPEPEARPQHTLDDYVRMVTDNPARISEVPAKQRGDVLQGVRALDAERIREQARQEAQFEQELAGTLAKFEAAWEAGDKDALDELEQQDKLGAARWHYVRYQKALQESGQGQQQQTAQAQFQRLQQRGEQAMARLADFPEAKARIEARVAASEYKLTEEDIDRFVQDVAVEIATAQAKPPRAGAPPVRTPRADVNGGIGDTGPGLTAEKYAERLKDNKVPTSKEIDEMTRKYLQPA